CMSVVVGEGRGRRLAGGGAIGRRVELLAIAERGGQIRVEPAAGRYRARDVLAGIAMAVESHLGGGALTAANLLVLGEFGRHRRIGNREIVAVAGAHAERPVGAGEGSIGRGRDIAAAAEPVVEE